MVNEGENQIGLASLSWRVSVSMMNVTDQRLAKVQ